MHRLPETVTSGRPEPCQRVRQNSGSSSAVARRCAQETRFATRFMTGSVNIVNVRPDCPCETGVEVAASPTVSIVLPTFNRSCFLPDAFRAIASQELTSWELLVIDDGSTDDTKSVVERLTAALPQTVRYQYQELIFL